MKTHCAQVENLFEAEKPYLSGKKRTRSPKSLFGAESLFHLKQHKAWILLSESIHPIQHLYPVRIQLDKNEQEHSK